MSGSTEPSGMMKAMRAVGVLTLLVVQGGGAVTYGLLAYYHRQVSSQMALPSAIGTITLFGDGGFTVLTPVEAVDVRVDERTIVTTHAGVGSLADLRPGATVIVSGHSEGRHLVWATSIAIGAP